MDFHQLYEKAKSVFFPLVGVAANL